MKTSIRKNLAIAAVILCTGLGATQAIATEKPTAEASVLASSKYVWRGFELSDDSIVIQPSATASYSGFSVNLWGNLDTGLDSATPSTNKWTETDMTLTYDLSLGPVGLTAGYIYYALDGAADTQEFFVSAALDVILNPTLSVYRDSDSFPGWYATLGASYSVPIKGDIALDLGVQAGYLSADDASSYAEVNNGVASATEAFSGLLDGLVSASVTFPINEYISITPELNYSFALTSDASDLLKLSNAGFSGDDSFVYGGVSVALAF